MGFSKEDLISIIAPALRGLLAQDGKLPVVTYDAQGSPNPSNAISVALDTSSTTAEIVARLKDAVSGVAEHVVVPEVGTFTRQATDETITGRVAGKVAVVTGAAQGFGLEIAQDLAAQGATVVLVDINEAGAHSAAQSLCERYGIGRALGLGINVTDVDSVRQAVFEIVKRFGGMDLFLSNAGVLKAESVKTQSLKDFEFVTSVNYTGYFVCVQQVAPVMAVQHLANSASVSDIIQINSKSGLQGSNRNGAYAGSKFGGLGLTQSFAMELIEDGIKVNSICPGNFFDGPLWSNPENGLFVQYLRTGKIPGAKTLEDVKKAYEAKVPMGRGCTTADVMNAVYYLVDQQYETGQAVPVTGGQVMLH